MQMEPADGCQVLLPLNLLHLKKKELHIFSEYFASQHPAGPQNISLAQPSWPFPGDRFFIEQPIENSTLILGDQFCYKVTSVKCPAADKAPRMLLEKGRPSHLLQFTGTSGWPQPLHGFGKGLSTAQNLTTVHHPPLVSRTEGTVRQPEFCLLGQH